MKTVAALLDRGLGVSLQPWYVGREDQAAGDEQKHHCAPVRGVKVDPRNDRGEHASDDEGQNHGEQRHRVRGDQRLPRKDGRDHGRLRGTEKLPDGGEDQRDQKEVQEVALESWNKRRNGDEGDHCGPAQVAPEHDLLAVEAIGDYSRGWCEEHCRNRVGEQRDRDRRAAARDVVGQDDQREQQELVRELRGELREPDVAKRGVPEHSAKASRWSLDGQPDRIHSR